MKVTDTNFMSGQITTNRSESSQNKYKRKNILNYLWSMLNNNRMTAIGKRYSPSDFFYTSRRKFFDPLG